MIVRYELLPRTSAAIPYDIFLKRTKNLVDLPAMKSSPAQPKGSRRLIVPAIVFVVLIFGALFVVGLKTAIADSRDAARYAAMQTALSSGQKILDDSREAVGKDPASAGAIYDEQFKKGSQLIDIIAADAEPDERAAIRLAKVVMEEIAPFSRAVIQAKVDFNRSFEELMQSPAEISAREATMASAQIYLIAAEEWLTRAESIATTIEARASARGISKSHTAELINGMNIPNMVYGAELLKTESSLLNSLSKLLNAPNMAWSVNPVTGGFEFESYEAAAQFNSIQKNLNGITNQMIEKRDADRLN